MFHKTPPFTVETQNANLVDHLQIRNPCVLLETAALARIEPAPLLYQKKPPVSATSTRAAVESSEMATRRLAGLLWRKNPSSLGTIFIEGRRHACKSLKSSSSSSAIPQQWRDLFQSSSSSTVTLASRSMATRATPNFSKKIDIAERARRKQARRLWTYGLSFAGIAGFIIIVLGSYQEYLVFYLTPSQALEKFRRDPSKNKFRLGGLVLEGSLVQPANSAEIEFVVTDLATDVLVRYKGALPDLFREGHSVVVEGFLKPLDKQNLTVFSDGRTVSEKATALSCYFAAIDVLAKHDEKYMPPEVAAAIEKNKTAIEAAHAAVSTAAQKEEEISAAGAATR